MDDKARKSGIDIIGDVAWGTHFCQFYRTKEDLTDILVPYFKAGLTNNEFCMWITSEPLGGEEAKTAMRRIMPDFDEYLKRGQIEIVPYTEWYLKGGAFSQQRVLNGWLDRLNKAMVRGYDGLRLTGNTFWLEKYIWRDFSDYEQVVNNVIGRYRMIAICTYSLDRCGVNEILDVVSTHQFALVKHDSKWELIESFELKGARHALRETERKYRDLFDNASDAIITIDLEDRVTSWNRSAERIFGWKADEAIGKNLPELIIPPDLKEERDRIIRDALTGRNITGIETTRLRKDGSRIGVSLTFSPIKDAEKKIIGLSGIIRDITERKRVEEALRKAYEQLEAANKGLEAFSYSVSHDLRAPLRSIDGFSQALLEDYAEKLDAQGKDYLQRVRAASQRMSVLIDDMLTLSRVTRREMKHEEVDLSTLAGTIAAELAKSQREVEFIIEPGVIVEGDPELLRVMLENLLGNAWKFTSGCQNARIEFGATEHEGKAAYFVRDNGVGFDMAYADKLFQAFQRLHAPNEFPGTGIGLATVKRIIHRHGGKVWAQGEVGKGATFYFNLGGIT